MKSNLFSGEKIHAEATVTKTASSRPTARHTEQRKRRRGGQHLDPREGRAVQAQFSQQRVAPSSALPASAFLRRRQAQMATVGRHTGILQPGQSYAFKNYKGIGQRRLFLSVFGEGGPPKKLLKKKMIQFHKLKSYSLNVKRHMNRVNRVSDRRRGHVCDTQVRVSPLMHQE